MNQEELRQHWEKVFREKSDDQKSWFQAVPTESIRLIKKAEIDPNTAIIDIGAGDSRLPDHLLSAGFKDISILDISEQAIVNSQRRLGATHGSLTWIVSDVRHFIPPKKYHFWHDRAAFHFLTRDEDIEAYIVAMHHSLAPSARALIACFSDEGPLKCSGLEVKRYSEAQLEKVFTPIFSNFEHQRILHKTPFGTTQAFLYCLMS